MPVNWIDVTDLSFNTLLLLEREQLGWLPGWVPEAPLAVALHAHPCVTWYLRHKNPALNPWLDELLAREAAETVEVEQVRQAEIAVLRSLNDLLTYAVDPALYDAQPFTGWDDAELTSLVDFAGKWVVDVGAGTGRLTLVAAPLAKAVWAVEPVANLRRFLREKAAARRLDNVYPVDGLITRLPFPDGFAGVTMGGHVFGDDPEAEVVEMERVTRPGGQVIFMPGSNAEREDEAHAVLIARGYRWGIFAEPEDGLKRKYWKTRTGGET